MRDDPLGLPNVNCPPLMLIFFYHLYCVYSAHDYYPSKRQRVKACGVIFRK